MPAIHVTASEADSLNRTLEADKALLDGYSGDVTLTGYVQD